MAPKRRHKDDDDDSQVEIIPTAFNSVGPSIANYAANSKALPNQTEHVTNSQGQRRVYSPSRPSMEALDPHPFSYPTRSVPQGSASNSSQPAEKSSGKRAVPHATPTDVPTTMRHSHPSSYPAKPKPLQSHIEPDLSATQPPPKKTRTKKVVNADLPAVEKRGVREKKSCPKNILDRVDRVMSQRCV